MKRTPKSKVSIPISSRIEYDELLLIIHLSAFADDLCSATPRLESLTLGLPRISRGE